MEAGDRSWTVSWWIKFYTNCWLHSYSSVDFFNMIDHRISTCCIHTSGECDSQNDWDDTQCTTNISQHPERLWQFGFFVETTTLYGWRGCSKGAMHRASWPVSLPACVEPFSGEDGFTCVAAMVPPWMDAWSCSALWGSTSPGCSRSWQQHKNETCL